MQWDLGAQGLAVLGAMSVGFGALAGLVVGKGVAHRLSAIAVTTAGVPQTAGGSARAGSS